MPTPAILSVTDAEVVPIVIRPSVELIRLFISFYLVNFCLYIFFQLIKFHRHHHHDILNRIIETTYF